MAETKSTAIEGVDSPNADVWQGPIPELDHYGATTGVSYVRCRACGVEVLEGDREYASHYSGCPHQ